MMNESRLNEIWNNYKLGYSQVWGQLTSIYRETGSPKTKEEFRARYVEKYGTETIRKVSERLASLSNYSVEECWKYVEKKVFEDTVNGFKKELQAIEIVQSLGYLTLEPLPSDDLECAIDFFVFKDSELLCTVQVKPISFFLGNSDSLIRDRAKTLKKFEKGYKIYGVPTYFMVYDRNNFMKFNGKYLVCLK